MHRGYVKLWRKSVNSVVFEDPELWKLWCICLMMATHKPMTTLLPETKVGIKLEPGEFLTGRFALHELYYPKKKKKNETRKSPVTLWRWLQKLESMEKLIIKSYSKASVITILNWNDYQVDDQQVINRCSTDDQQMITDKNSKNDKNNKNTIPYSKIISFLNEKANRSFKQTAATKGMIKARFNEGFSLSDFEAVIESKVYEWNTDDEMAKYLRPQTLFGTKFEGYLQASLENKPKTKYKWYPNDEKPTDLPN